MQTETREQLQQQRAVQQIQSAAAAAEETFSKQNADYWDALAHLREIRAQQLRKPAPQELLPRPSGRTRVVFPLYTHAIDRPGSGCDRHPWRFSPVPLRGPARACAPSYVSRESRVPPCRRQAPRDVETIPCKHTPTENSRPQHGS